MPIRHLDGIAYEVGSGNVFSDLNLPDAEKLKTKTDLIIKIVKAIEAQGLTRQQAAYKMGLTHAAVSEMIQGNLELFSERKLMECLNSLGYDIEIKIKPANISPGQIHVAFAWSIWFVVNQYMRCFILHAVAPLRV